MKCSGFVTGHRTIDCYKMKMKIKSCHVNKKTNMSITYNHTI